MGDASLDALGASLRDEAAGAVLVGEPAIGNRILNPDALEHSSGVCPGGIAGMPAREPNGSLGGMRDLREAPRASGERLASVQVLNIIRDIQFVNRQLRRARALLVAAPSWVASYCQSKAEGATWRTRARTRAPWAAWALCIREEKSVRFRESAMLPIVPIPRKVL